MLLTQEIMYIESKQNHAKSSSFNTDIFSVELYCVIPTYK